MGLFDKLFGGHKDLPPLAADSEAQANIEDIRTQLEVLTGEIKDPMEVVPANNAAYVFIGKPPTKFGLAWIHDGEVSNFKKLAEEKNLSPPRLERLIEELRAAYKSTSDAPRFSTQISGREIVVTPSPDLQREVHKLIENVTH